MRTEKLSAAIKYAREVLNTLPVVGAANMRRVCEADALLSELQGMAERGALTAADDRKEQNVTDLQ